MPFYGWRTGRTLGRTLYVGDVFVGMMDTPQLAEVVKHAVNAWLRDQDHEHLWEQLSSFGDAYERCLGCGVQRELPEV